MYTYYHIPIYIRRPLVGHKAAEKVFSHKSLSKCAVTGHQSIVGTCLPVLGTWPLSDSYWYSPGTS